MARLLAASGLPQGGAARAVVLSLLIQLFAMALPILTGVLVDEVVPHQDVGLLKSVGRRNRRCRNLLFPGISRPGQCTGIPPHTPGHPTGTRLHGPARSTAIQFFFVERPTGDLLVRYQSNQRVREILTSAALSTILDGALVCLYLLVILMLSPALAALASALGALQVILFIATRRRYHELATENLEVRARSNSHLVEMISGIENAQGTWY